MGSCDVNTGNYILFDEKTPTADLPLTAVSSASIPFVFPHREYNGMVLADGSTAWNSNLVSAVDKCRELVDDDANIILDVIICS